MSQPLTAQPNPLNFPSWSDLRGLRQRLKNSGFQSSGLTNAERWRYHAYDYAFLRVRHHRDDRSYPLDPEGKWFHGELVDQAERIYREHPTPPGMSVCRAEIERDPESAAHFQRQDDERMPLKRQVQVHGERLSNRGPTPEMLAFMGCCMRQCRQNEKILVTLGRRTFAPEARMTPQQILDALGVIVTERKPKYVDPDELRKGREALGLESSNAV